MALRHRNGLGMIRIRMCSLSTSRIPTYYNKRKPERGSHYRLSTLPGRVKSPGARFKLFFFEEVASPSIARIPSGTTLEKLKMVTFFLQSRAA